MPDFRILKLTFPNNSNLRNQIAELVDFLNTQSYLDVGFNIQVLPNSSVVVDIEYRLDPKDKSSSEETLSNLDILTS